jgi:flagellar motor switch protein FliG
MPLNSSHLDQILEEFISTNKKPEKILIGYKAYAELMNDRTFMDEVAGSAMNPNKRKYKKIKIKVTQDEYQLEVKSSKE